MDVGSRLRSAREAKGLSVQALSKITRVKPSVLVAVENNDAAAIPPRPYGRGFVSAYASQVGLDPQQTVRDYFLQFATSAGGPVSNQPQPAPVTALHRPFLRPAYIGGAVLLIVAVAVAAPLIKRQALSASSAAGAPPPASAPTAVPADTVGTGGAADSAVAPVAAPAAPLTIEIEALEPVWVTASADAQRTLYRTLQAGERQTLRGDREIAIVVGNAGLLRWRVNDRPEAVMGARGAVQSVRVTAAGVEVLPAPPRRAKVKRHR
jgi:hypothetical protein